MLRTWVIAALLLRVESFVGQCQSQRYSSRTSFVSVASTATSEEQFETWFRTLDKAVASVQHRCFGAGRLRGLTLTPTKDEKNNPSCILTVPRQVVLQASKKNEDWDTQLATKLFRACTLPENTLLSPYIALLKAEPIAPNALRHWTKEQRALLQDHVILQKLKEQEKEWKRKHDPKIMSWDQFSWCMQVVYSRAYAGNFGGPNMLLPASVSSAIILGGYAMTTNNDALLLAAALIVGAMTVVSMKTDQDAVLLPFIDSANHLDDATDSKIEYDPLAKSFSLCIGPNCIRDEQVYVSYGKKSDTEWLLNYGFLPGVSCSEGESQDDQRRQLAKAFLLRNR